MLGPLYNQIITLLTLQPGNLVYHLVLLFSIAAAIPGAISLWLRSGMIEGRRMIVGLGLLLISQLGLVVLAGIASFFPNYNIWLPVLDRTVIALSVVVLIWLWAFPSPARTADIASLLLILLVFILGVFSSISWSNGSGNSFFNGSPLDLIWAGFTLTLAVAGVVLVLIRRPPGFETGIAVFLLLSIGELVHIILPLPQSDYPGSIRLVQIAAFPLLLTLPSRFGAETPVNTGGQYLKGQTSLPPELFQVFLSLATSTSQLELCRGISATVSRALSADLCLLMSPPDQKKLISIHCGYNFSSGEYVPSATFDGQLVPVIAEALRQGRPLHLPSGSNIPDLAGLETILSLPLSGSLLLSPLTSSSGEVLMALVLLTPFTGRKWTARDENYLADISPQLAEILKRALQSEGINERLDQANRAVEFLNEENQRLTRSLQELTSGHASDLPADVVQLQDNLQSSFAEIALLQQLLVDRGRRSPAGQILDPGNKEKLEALGKIAQDLHQPVASIINHADLLLAESLGTLGVSQHKLVERIKTSAQRVGHLSDILMKATLEDVPAGSFSGVIDIKALISAQISRVSSQVREKDLRLMVDIPSTLPPISGDLDAVAQALKVLLVNAIEVTPPSEDIVVNARLNREDNDFQFVQILIADRGGGISPEYQEQVFPQVHNAEEVFIQGIGIDPVDISIARSLVEANHGRLLFESEPGRGCTFNLLLPVATLAVRLENQEEFAP